MMRKTIILILATLIAASGSEALAQTGNAVSSSSENKREIRLTPCNKDKGDDKSLFAEVEAWYDSSSMLMTAAHAAAANETAEDTTVTQKPTAVSNHTISMQILGLEYGYEQKLGGSFSMVFRAGLVPAGIYVFNDYFSFGYSAAMKLGVNVEPRFYTNFDRRQRLGKSTYKNSADFVALKVQTALGNRFIPDISEFEDLSFSSRVDVSITPMYGIRRVWGKNWFGEFSVGARIGWQIDWYVAPYIQYRIGLAF